MIRASIAATRADLLAFAAHLARSTSEGLALLLGEGFGEPTLAVGVAEELVVPAGSGIAAVQSVLDDLDGVAPPAGADERYFRGWNGRGAAPRWIGALAYEAGRVLEGRGPDGRPERSTPALHLRRFGAVLRLDGTRGQLVCEGDDLGQVERLDRLARELRALQREGRLDGPLAPTLDLRPTDSDEAHRRRVERALEWIAAGDIYQVNLARVFAGAAPVSPLGLLADPRWSSARFAAALVTPGLTVVSASPELLLEVGPRWRAGGAPACSRPLRSDPIKGTRPRGSSEPEERRLLAELAGSEKERAELTMIVDLTRNDLGRVGQLGSVRVLCGPMVHTTPYVHHNVHPVMALAAPGLGLGALVASVFPGGSVTGAPKRRAMEIIAQLEEERRGLYCGALLVIDRAMGMKASMAIRTLEVDPAQQRARYMVGGGIVADSLPLAEVAETHWKARLVTSP